MLAYLLPCVCFVCQAVLRSQQEALQSIMRRIGDTFATQSNSGLRDAAEELQVSPPLGLSHFAPSADTRTRVTG